MLSLLFFSFGGLEKQSERFMTSFIFLLCKSMVECIRTSKNNMINSLNSLNRDRNDSLDYVRDDRLNL